MKNLFILIKELGNIEQLSVTESLANLLWKDEFELEPVDSRDMRVSNLPFGHDVYETRLESYRQLLEVASMYEKMDKAISYYQSRYSAKLVHSITGDVNDILTNLDTLDKPQNEEVADVRTVPNLVLQRIKNYFVDNFLIKNVQLSTEKHANIKYVDGTAEFRVVFTVLDVALPDDKGFYQREPLICDVFGRYQADQIQFDFNQIKTNKDRYFGYDEQLYDKRQAYIGLITARCKDKSGNSLEQCLHKVANEFVHGFDFYLE